MSDLEIKLAESRVIYSTKDLEEDFPDFKPEPGKRDPEDVIRDVLPIGPMHMHSLMDFPNGDLLPHFDTRKGPNELSEP